MTRKRIPAQDYLYALWFKNELAAAKHYLPESVHELRFDLVFVRDVQGTKDAALGAIVRSVASGLAPEYLKEEILRIIKEQEEPQP